MDEELYGRTLDGLKSDYEVVEREYRAAGERMLAVVNAIRGLSILLGRPQEERYEHPTKKFQREYNNIQAHSRSKAPQAVQRPGVQPPSTR